MSWTEILGYVAAFCTTFSFLPQALKTFKTKDVSSISLGMYVIFTSGVFLWLVYGVLKGVWPIVLANAVTLLLAGAILWLKLKYDGK